jgi:small subunit ribosomal protein S6
VTTNVNVYEGMFILDSNRYSRDPAGVSGQVIEMIQALGGEILVSRLWEDRRLEYPIKGHRRGTYWLTYFKLDSKQLVALNRQCQLNDTIVRMLFLKIHPRLVDAVVEHAKQGPTAVRRPERGERDYRDARPGRGERAAVNVAPPEEIEEEAV